MAPLCAMRVAHEIADIVIRNNDDISEYHLRIDELVGTFEIESERRLHESELHRSLRALHKIGRAATCDEIADVTADQGHRVRKYNNDRALKGIPEFATRVKKSGQLLKYRLSSRGAALLELLEPPSGGTSPAPSARTIEAKPRGAEPEHTDRHSADEVKP
jgi:hypothetical protein